MSNVQNGNERSEDKMFMTTENVPHCLNSLKLKNSEGHNRIPHITLMDGISVLLYSLKILFQLIYEHNIIASNGKLQK